jgi:hypothetical protein
MRFFSVCSTIFVLLVSSATAFAAEAFSRVDLSLGPKGDPNAVWAAIGDFCGISSWHPDVGRRVLSADGKRRTLSLKGGGTLTELLETMDAANHSYSYTILSGTWPVTKYHAKLEVVVNPSIHITVLSWGARYEAKGVPAASAKKLVDDFFSAGLDGLFKQVSKGRLNM